MRNNEPIDDVPIATDMIRLGQFLKFSGLGWSRSTARSTPGVAGSCTTVTS
jgi:hypothetical protein